MAKKIWYSVPLRIIWQELYRRQKQFTPELSDDQIFMVLRNNMILSAKKENGNIGDHNLMVSGLQLWRQDLKGEFLHVFFLEKILRDFLESTSLADLNGIRKYLQDNGEEKNIVYIKVNGQTQCVNYSFGLHIPYEKEGYAFSLSLFENGSIELYFICGDTNGLLSDSMYHDLIKKNDKHSVILAKMFRLAINTLAYMNCFPECVTEGVPRITYDQNERRSPRNFSFRLSDKIITGLSPTSKIPHFRKGYFKLLQSEYFKKKRGELVYVNETMVKGRAKTVTKDPSIENSDDIKLKNKSGLVEKAN